MQIILNTCSTLYDYTIIDGSTARRCIAIVTNERRASYVIPLNASWESRLKTP